MLYSKKGLAYERSYAEGVIGRIRNEIIRERISNVLVWYITSAHRQRGRHLFVMVLASLLNAAVPVLALSHGFELFNILIASFSALSGVLMICGAHYKWHDNWLKSRRNAEIIKSKTVLYVNRAEPYDGNNADAQFLQEIEQLIVEDGNKWYEVRAKQDTTPKVP